MSTKKTIKQANAAKPIVRRSALPMFRRGQIVTVQVYGPGPLHSEEPGYKILKVDKRGVWLDNGDGNDPKGPYDPNTGEHRNGSVFGVGQRIVA